MFKKLSLLTIVILLAITHTNAANSIVPFGNGAWVHDYTTTAHDSITDTQAGRFFNKLKTYNQGAKPGHQITEVFAYGGTLEMYPPKSGDYLPNNFGLLYYPERGLHANLNNWKSWQQQLGSGFISVHAYSHLTVNGQTNGKKVLNVMQINGTTGIKTIHRLQYLNGLNQTDAAHFADFVAGQVCSDDIVDGVQFDLQPFTVLGSNSAISGPGQKYFFTKIAKDFAGQYQSGSGNNDPLNCVDSIHPRGRIFSILTSVSAIQEDPSAIANILNQYGNGYVIDTLYDLNGQPAGTANSPAAYQQQIVQEINGMQQLAKQYKIYYQFAIPASASAHEFEKIDTSSTGYTQLDYVKAAINTINKSGVRHDPYFRGVALWGWNNLLVTKDPRSKKVVALEPANPNVDSGQTVLHYLQNAL